LQYLKATELAEKEQRLQEIQYQQLILLGEEREANQRELLPQHQRRQQQPQLLKQQLQQQPQQPQQQQQLLQQHQLQQLLQQLQQQL